MMIILAAVMISVLILAVVVLFPLALSGRISREEDNER